jgi:soluble lytic murein transglycosylase
MVAALLLGAPGRVTASDDPPPALAAPYAEWLDALGASAQALFHGRPREAGQEAARALGARAVGLAGARARLAAGLAAGAAGRPAEALAALEPSPPVASELEPAAGTARAEALLAGGRAREAASTFAALAAGDGALARRAQRRHADALLAAGDAPSAATAYQALLASGADASSSARLALADAWRAAGEHARAAAAYRELWLELPADPAGRAAGRKLAAWQRAGGPVPPATLDEQLARAERLVLLSHPRRALAALGRLPETEAEPAARAALLRAWALLQLGRPADAEAWARCAEQAAAGTRIGARLALARAAARLGRVDEAIARYAALAAEPAAAVPGLAPAAARELPDDAAYLAAWLPYDAGRFADAAVALRRFALERPRSPRALDARWFEAWSLRRLGRAGDARAALERLERTALEPAALYWRARLEPAARARPLYRRALAADGDGWYGLLASSRLTALGERAAPAAPPRATAAPEVPAAPAPAAALARAAALLGAGLREEAIAELRALAGGPHARAGAVAAAQLAAAAGDPELPFRLARDQLALTTRTVRWLHPEAWPERLPELAARAGVDRFLLLALVRRESSFRPDARSPAGAVGLVQLLPATAERLARLLGVADPGARGLEDPAVSLPLGAAYLALLRDRFPDPAVALAAYNAGPRPAAAWATARAGRPLDEWVEEIPFRETRRYVKTVLAAEAAYRALWAGGARAIDGARPVRPPRSGVAF